MIPDVRKCVSERREVICLLVLSHIKPILLFNMYKQLLLIMTIFCSFRSFSQQTSPGGGDHGFVVKVNKNVELLGFVYFLGYEGAQSETDGYSAKTKARYAYGLDVYHRYKSFANSKNLAVLELSTHEFGHSFVNSAVDRIPATLITDTQSLYEPISQTMSNQAYTTWKSCLYEHFVRAGEIIIAQNLGNTADAQALKEHYIVNRRFIYLPALLIDLESYNARKSGSYTQAVAHAMKRLQKIATKH